MARDNWHQQVSWVIADSHGTAVIEKLNARGMTASAKGTAMNHGKNVSRKAGLNRSVLATGWHGFKMKLDCKAASVIEVKAACTSQTCSACGHTAKVNRCSQSRFQRRAEHTGPADQAQTERQRDSVTAGQSGIQAPVFGYLTRRMDNLDLGICPPPLVENRQGTQSVIRAARLRGGNSQMKSVVTFA